ncbi:uncharacterized protein LOC115876121 [Sitophilus oryzae]|uniref:Uncharacterized protein LOC115876121 n=1 Tax=Sitophilus oryzae TaxID=7048 RepID=A0A6J2X8X9_SITOR|nr:uncharacterized protein LOC115876121 [Sitophilus oryzae]
MDAIRRSARTSRLDRVRNEIIRDKMGRQKTIVEEIESAQLKRYGHVRRMDNTRLPQKVLNWLPQKRRKRGRPRTNWMEGVKKVMSSRDLRDGDWNERNQRRLAPHNVEGRFKSDSYISLVLQHVCKIVVWLICDIYVNML